MITKEKIYDNIEKLIRDSFEEDVDDLDTQDGSYKFKREYPIRSKCFWNIDHFLQYIKNAIDSC